MVTIGYYGYYWLLLVTIGNYGYYWWGLTIGYYGYYWWGLVLKLIKEVVPPPPPPPPNLPTYSTVHNGLVSSPSPFG